MKICQLFLILLLTHNFTFSANQTDQEDCTTSAFEPTILDKDGSTRRASFELSERSPLVPKIAGGTFRSFLAGLCCGQPKDAGERDESKRENSGGSLEASTSSQLSHTDTKNYGGPSFTIDGERPRDGLDTTDSKKHKIITRTVVRRPVEKTTKRTVVREITRLSETTLTNSSDEEANPLAGETKE